MRKPTICICENKDADQLCGNREADQHLHFRYIDSTISLLSKSEIQASSHLLWLYSLVCVRPGRKPERWFSHDTAHMLETCLEIITEKERGMKLFSRIHMFVILFPSHVQASALFEKWLKIFILILSLHHYF